MRNWAAQCREYAILQDGLCGTCTVAHGEADRRVAVDIAPGQVGPVQQQLVHTVRMVLHRREDQRGASILIL